MIIDISDKLLNKQEEAVEYCRKRIAEAKKPADCCSCGTITTYHADVDIRHVSDCIATIKCKRYLCQNCFLKIRDGQDAVT